MYRSEFLLKFGTARLIPTLMRKTSKESSLILGSSPEASKVPMSRCNCVLLGVEAIKSL